LATSVLTYVGEEFIVDKLVENSNNLCDYVGWGTGAGTAAKGDTTLFTEASEARVQGTVSKTGTGATAKYQLVSTLTANGAKTITNAGNFTASVAGTLMIHGDFTGITLAENDQIQFTFTLDPS